MPVRWVRRIAWQWRGSDLYQPGTLFYLDGRKLKFRSIRLEQNSARVLLAEGVAEASFGEIAELHLPWADPWEAYYEALVPLAPRGEGLLMQIETAGGLRVTASTERFQSRSRGDPNDPKSWVQLFQPAWSDDPFWIEHRSIRLRRCFPPQRVPLPLIAPRRTRQESPLGGSWPAQVNRSVQGGPLSSGGAQYGWGFGVQARTELEFDLPPFARSLRARAGLDRAAGSGGCARALITAGSEPLFRSNLLIGSGRVADTGSLPLESRGQPLPLLLVADLAHADRPPGADPLDIRDSLDWLEPEVELDPGALRQEILRRAPRAIPAWQGFTVEGSETPVEIVNRWEGADPRTLRARLEVAPLLKYLKLSRQAELGGDERLLLGLSRQQGRPPARVQVVVNGRPAGEFEAPERRGGVEPEAIPVPLEGRGKRRAVIEIFQHMGGPQTSIEWRALSIAPAPAPQERRKASR